jgi:NAD(P)-dependent dehydrogenase (short-subunit alcohol dehydrogenase family)
MPNLAGQVAVVTGAGSGIGQGIALALAHAGADILVADIDLARARQTAERIIALQRRALPWQTDVRHQQSLEAMAGAAVQELGRLDICVANAGIGRGGLLLTMSVEDWESLMAVNLTGVFLTVQACARRMVRQNQGGRIITIASLAAERPYPQVFAYCASKAGVRMMTRCWAQELAPFDITVNSIGPGVIDTPLAAGVIGERETRQQLEHSIPAGRVGTPTDIGHLACWLASPEAAYMTGTYTIIDGGLGDRGSLSSGDSSQQRLLHLRQQRQQTSGEELLAMLDRQAAHARHAIESARRTRGLL